MFMRQSHNPKAKNSKLIFSLVTAFVAFSLLLNGCSPSQKKEADSPKITVAAAISMSDALTAMKKEFNVKYPDIQVQFNYGASGILQHQIEQGSPIDVFVSAGEKQMEILKEKDMMNNSSIKPLVQNSMVLIVPAKSSSTLENFNQLKETPIKKIALGNPKTVPAGQYGKQVLEYYNIYSQIEPKIVFAENVRQALKMVSTGNADAGIVYKTDAISDPGVKVVAEAPANSHKPVIYPIGILKSTPYQKAAQQWEDFSLSPEGQNLLAKYGFVPAQS